MVNSINLCDKGNTGDYFSKNSFIRNRNFINLINFNNLYNPNITRPQNCSLKKKLSFQVIENGTILPSKNILDGLVTTWPGFGGVVDSKGEAVKNAFSVSNNGTIYNPPFESIQHSSETVIYLGMFVYVWGHFITDSIRFMWFLNSEDFNQFKNCRLVYIPWFGIPFEKSPDRRRLLEILGLKPERIHPITQPTQFKRIIIPDSSFESNPPGYFTNEHREVIDIFRNFARKNRTSTSSKKFYFFYGSNQVGEERVAEYFKSKGYEIITHEKRLNFDEQLNRLINCESFASPLGSVAHNSIFLREGAEAIFIPRSTNAFLFHQQKVIDQMNSLNANYIDSTLSIFNVGHDSFCFIISEQLKRFFGDKFDGYEEGDFKAFLDYINSPVRRGRAINPHELQLIGSVFTDFMAQLKQHKELIATYNMPSDWENFQPQLTYQTHVHMKGWRDGWNIENKPSNPLDQKLEILAIQLNYPGHKIYYQVYFNDEEGWSKEVESPKMAGTVGVRKPIYGMRVRLDEAGAKEFDILYRMHKFDDTWTPWAKNGEALYSHGQKLNAIQIKLENKKDVI
ncbi:MAG: DUF563 domain-containing protein [Selenomonadaceae bacterium]|nr:DUF563 domain-containing protein [Selenomonadaceae bacterium]